jgi:hypothetical protein
VVGVVAAGGVIQHMMPGAICCRCHPWAWQVVVAAELSQVAVTHKPLNCENTFESLPRA